MAAAVAANTLLSKGGHFDLRAIGLIHGALFLLALYLLSTLLDDAPRALRLATYGAALFCFTDVMYVSYLNSFYMDVAAWLFLSIAAMLYLRWLRWGRRAGRALLCGLLCDGGHLKSAACDLRILAGAAPACWRLPSLAETSKVDRWRPQHPSRFWRWCGSGKSAPSDYAPRGVFTMAFYRILPHSKNVEQTISALGIDESYRRYIGMHSFAEGSPMEDAAFVERFRSRISYRSLLWFYLTHPADLYAALRLSLSEAGDSTPEPGQFRRAHRISAVSGQPGVFVLERSEEACVRHARIALFLYVSRSGNRRRNVCLRRSAEVWARAPWRAGWP